MVAKRNCSGYSPIIWKLTVLVSVSSNSSEIFLEKETIRLILAPPPLEDMTLQAAGGVQIFSKNKYRMF